MPELIFNHLTIFQENGHTSLRRAHSEELLSEVGFDDSPPDAKKARGRSLDKKKTSNSSGISSGYDDSSPTGGLLQVSDHPRLQRPSSADSRLNGGHRDTSVPGNNYENFAHDLSHSSTSGLPSYLWPNPMMTNTRDLSHHQDHNKRPQPQPQPHQFNIDLNSTNSDSCSHQSHSDHNMSMEAAATHRLLSVNSRPSTSLSPERRLDYVLGTENNNLKFSDSTPSAKMATRPIPTFSTFGHSGGESAGAAAELHRARPAFAPTPSPGAGSESDQSSILHNGSVTGPPLPSRPQVQPNGLPVQNSQQPSSLPFFPFHQFPGRSVKPMRKFNSTTFLPLLY